MLHQTPAPRKNNVKKVRLKERSRIGRKEEKGGKWGCCFQEKASSGFCTIKATRHRCPAEDLRSAAAPTLMPPDLLGHVDINDSEVLENSGIRITTLRAHPVLLY